MAAESLVFDTSCVERMCPVSRSVPVFYCVVCSIIDIAIKPAQLSPSVMFMCDVLVGCPDTNIEM